MDMQSSRTPNMHTVAHWDCRTMPRKSNGVVAQQRLALELVGHKRMLRSQCLESKLYMNNPFKNEERIMETYPRGTPNH